MKGKWKVGIATVDDVRARCVIDERTRCWVWQGAMRSRDGAQQPAMWAFDHARGEKRTMTGPQAVWNIAHGRAPLPGYVVHRACCNPLCLNPVHLREAKSLAEVGRHRQRAGVDKGRHVESKRANIAKAHAAAGVVQTPDPIVIAIRQAPPTVTGRALSKMHGISEQTVSRIRRGVRRCDARARVSEPSHAAG